MSTHQYDVCVIGGGLIGSAAAKYAVTLGAKTCLIAAPEPNREDYRGHDIFGAFYDEARITRRLDNDPFWSHIAGRSIDKYRDIEKESGISFYTENGYLCLSDAGSPFLKDNLRVAKENKIAIKHFQSHELSPVFPYLKPLPRMEGLLERKDAGMINPRKLVEAQKTIFLAKGGQLISDIAIRVTKVPANNGSDVGFKIETKRQGIIYARKVVLCVGAFIHHGHLLPQGVELELTSKASSATRIELDEALLPSLKQMPSVYFDSVRNFGHGGPYKNQLRFYMLPPVYYPKDGKWFLKLGYSDHVIGPRCQSPAEISQWFKSEDPVRGELLAKEAKSFIAGLNPKRTIVDTCVTVDTPTGHPYLDEVEPGWFLAAGGHGWAAKSSNELGSIIATLAVTSQWDCPFPQKWFKAVKRPTKARI
jgi:sarcosine oxidase